MWRRRESNRALALKTLKLLIPRMPESAFVPRLPNLLYVTVQPLPRIPRTPELHLQTVPLREKSILKFTDSISRFSVGQPTNRILSEVERLRVSRRAPDLPWSEPPTNANSRTLARLSLFIPPGSLK